MFMNPLMLKDLRERKYFLPSSRADILEDAFIELKDAWNNYRSFLVEKEKSLGKIQGQGDFRWKCPHHQRIAAILEMDE